VNRCDTLFVGDVTWRKGTSEWSEFRVWREQAVVSNGVKSRRWNERSESAQKFDRR
jgi:hypothetical protein